MSGLRRLKCRKGRDPGIIPDFHSRLSGDRKTRALNDQLFTGNDVFPNPRGVWRRSSRGEKRLRANMLSRKQLNPKLVMRGGNRPSKLTKKGIVKINHSSKT